jgi:hypothetical protein
MTTQTIRIARRFNGPHDSGNGGYAAGLAAQSFPAGSAVEVTLRAAIPLEEDLQVVRKDDGLAIVSASDPSTLIIAARPTQIETPDIRSPGLEAARVASQTYRGAEDHVLPHCFVCGRLPSAMACASFPTG